jgi:hypothetical protein
MRYFMAAVGLILASVAFAQQRSDDPYGEQYRASVLAQHSELKSRTMDDISYVFFAAGCKVVPNEGFVLPLVNDMIQSLIQEGAQDQIADERLPISIKEAEDLGLSRSHNPGACAFWHDHPREVFKVRRLIDEAMNSAPAPY